MGWEDALKGMATHSSILAWEIPGQRSLAGYTVHGVAKSQARLKQLSTGEENGTPLQFCLETEEPDRLWSIGSQRVTQLKELSMHSLPSSQSVTLGPAHLNT